MRYPEQCKTTKSILPVDNLRGMKTSWSLDEVDGTNAYSLQADEKQVTEQSPAEGLFNPRRESWPPTKASESTAYS
jgi:hypothetical protein